MTITTEEAEALAERMTKHVRDRSGPVLTTGAWAMMLEAGEALRALAAERDRARRAREAAARAQGEAEGKLAASDMAGVVEGWKERAEAAEARRDFLSDRVDTLLAAGAGAELAMAALRDRAERAEAEAEKLREGAEKLLESYESRWTPIKHGAVSVSIESLAQAENLREAASHIISTFEKDEAQGYRSKDRQFAISILRAALEGGDNPDSPTRP